MYGSYIFFGQNIVSWSSKKHPLVARSNIEVEYHALAHTISKLFWLESLLEELCVTFYHLTLYVTT